MIRGQDNATRGLIVAAPASGSGKTTFSLALLRHLKQRGIAVASIKIGPDYIDPAFHLAASGRPCYNFDTWAMSPATLAAVAMRAAHNADLVVGEGVMGLFDGAPGGEGSTAEASVVTGWPVILVVDASGMAASAAAVVHGFDSFRGDVELAGVVFNRVGSPGHARILERACAQSPVPVLGCLPREAGLALPSRHLGLVQASEHPELDALLDQAARMIERHVDVDALLALARPLRMRRESSWARMPAPGQRISIARDTAFAFVYEHLLDQWRRDGVELHAFSPLRDEPPADRADAVYLPGGYPELHAGRLAANRRFLDGLRAAARRGAWIYGECGGYMVLGRALTDADAETHRMAGLLPVETTFAERKLTLGYRALTLAADCPLGPAGARFRGHEFHFARVLREDPGPALFECRDAGGQDLGGAGRRRDTVAGSFIHLVDARWALPER